MSYLRNHCLGRQPMTHEEVNAIYKSGKCPGLCMSHERLRAELTGLEIVWQQAQTVVDRLRERIQRERETGMVHHAELLEQILGDYK